MLPWAVAFPDPIEELSECRDGSSRLTPMRPAVRLQVGEGVLETDLLEVLFIGEHD